MDVRYVISVDDKGGIRKLQELDETMTDLKQKSSAADSAFGRLFATFTLGSVAANLINKTLSSMQGFATLAIQGAIQEEQSQRRLATALEMAGFSRRASLPGLLAFAQAQSQATLYTHEEVEASMALLESVTKLDNEGLKRAMIGVEGLASTLGPDEGGLRGATMLVMRAVQGNTTALQRAGIIIDQSIPPHDRLKYIIERLAALYPRATAEIETMGGKVTQAKKAFAEFAEGLGHAVMDATQAGDLLPIATQALKGMTDETTHGTSELVKYNQQMGAIRGWLSPYTVQTNAAAQAMAGAKDKALAFGAALFAYLPQGAFQSTVSIKALGKALDDLKSKFDTVKNFKYEVQDLFPFGDIQDVDINDAIEKIFPVDVPIELPKFFEGILDAGDSKMKTFWDAEYHRMTEAKQQFDRTWQGMERGWGSAIGNMMMSATSFKDFMSGIWKSFEKEFADMVGRMAAKWANDLLGKLFFPNQAKGGGGFFGGVLGFLGGLIGLQHGFEGVVSRPTPIIVGEAGPEYVSVRPMTGSPRGGGGVTIINNWNIRANDARGVEAFLRQQAGPILQSMIDHGDLRT